MATEIGMNLAQMFVAQARGAVMVGLEQCSGVFALDDARPALSLDDDIRLERRHEARFRSTWQIRPTVGRPTYLDTSGRTHFRVAQDKALEDAPHPDWILR